MSAENPFNSKEVASTNVLVRRGLKEGQDPATQGVEVWKLTDEIENGKQVAVSQVPKTEIAVIPQDGSPSYIEKQYPHRALTAAETSAEAQYALAREYAGKPLRGDKLLADIDGSVKEVLVGEFSQYTDGRTGDYAGVTDAFGNEVGIDSKAFKPEHQALLRQRKELADTAIASFEASTESRRELEKMTLPEIQTALPEQTRQKDILSLDTYAAAINWPGADGIMVRKQALERMSLAAQGVSARYAELSQKK